MKFPASRIKGILSETKYYLILSLFLCQLNINAQNEAVINLDSTRQVIQGFGAANILAWRPDMTSDEIERAFGTGDGQIGFSILRLRIPPNEYEFQQNVATAKAAYEMGVKIIASPWSPPADMKTNNSTVGGRLLEEYYDDYALHLKSFADFMENNGVPLYAVSVQNEPDVQVTYESCDWNADEMVKFMRENAPSVGRRVIAPESYQFLRPISDAILNDSAACANLDIVGGHIYGGGLAPYPLAGEKGKEIWMTEHLILETDWPANLSTGKDILDCMNAGMSAYIWWYIVRFYGPIYDEGTDPRTPPGAVKGEISKRGFVMSQFARFIRPGYHRVDTYIPNGNVLVSAFKDSSDSKIVIVAINNGYSDVDQTFILQNGSASGFMRYETSESKNCEKGSDVSVSDDRFTATLEARSVTTFTADLITAAEKEINKPESFGLYQNYPNPFNPSTTIKYSIPDVETLHATSLQTRLIVYDVLGRVVAELVNERKEAGTYQVILNSAGLSSGVYYYQLRSGSYVATKKMILLK